MDPRLRGDDTALNDTSMHLTSSMPPMTYPPFGSTAVDPPRAAPYSPPATANLRRTDEVRAVAMDGPGRRAQGSSPATVERRPPRGWCRHHPSRGFEPSRKGQSSQWLDWRREGHESYARMACAETCINDAHSPD